MPSSQLTFKKFLVESSPRCTYEVRYTLNGKVHVATTSAVSDKQAENNIKMRAARQYYNTTNVAAHKLQEFSKIFDVVKTVNKTDEQDAAEKYRKVRG